MRYGEGLLEEIRRRTDLVQLVGRRVKLIRKGRVMWGCCPFHAEKSPQLLFLDQLSQLFRLENADVHVDERGAEGGVSV